MNLLYFAFDHLGEANCGRNLGEAVSPDSPFFYIDPALDRIYKMELDFFKDRDIKFFYLIEPHAGLEHYLGLPVEDKRFSHSFLKYLPNLIKEKVDDGQCFIVITYMQEGHVDSQDIINLYEKLIKYKISPKQVIFICANYKMKLVFNRLQKKLPNLIKEKLHLITTDHLLEQMTKISNDYVGGWMEQGYDGKSIDKRFDQGINTPDKIRKTKNKLRPYKFLSFNRNMGKAHRPFLASLFLKENWIGNEGLVSVGPVFEMGGLLGWDNPEEVIQNKKYIELLGDYPQKLKSMAPIFIDSDIINKQYDIWPGFQYPKTFNKVYLDVVNESTCSDDSLFFTEKTYLAISMLLPFIVLASSGALKELRNIGFKTFSPFIDESYDDVENWEDRVIAVYESVKQFVAKPIEEIHDWYWDIYDDVLVHNWNILLNRKSVDHKNIYTYLAEL